MMGTNADGLDHFKPLELNGHLVLMTPAFARGQHDPPGETPAM